MECLTKHRAALAFKRGKNGLNVLICLFTGETAVICAQHKVERNALLPIGNAGAAVNVKERYFLEKALCTAANALFERADRDGAFSLSPVPRAADRRKHNPHSGKEIP